MRHWVLWAALGMGVFPSTSRADLLLEPGAIVRGAAEGSHLKKLVTAPSEWSVTFAPGGAPPAPGSGTRARVDYPSLLSKLVITRDLSLPGLSFLALRLIPTRRALGGEGPSPVVIRPRVVAADWYGLDVTARF